MKLSLEKTWTECLRMWEDIAAEIRKLIKKGAENIDYDVEELKYDWLEQDGYEPDNIQAQCFFCDYQRKHAKTGFEHVYCSRCPAKKIDKNFCCDNDDYDYQNNPLAFYAKLVELNRIRKNKKARPKARSEKMKIDRIKVRKHLGDTYDWIAVYENGNFAFQSNYIKRKGVIEEATDLAKKLGCKLELPKEGGK